ncbi:MAG: AMP-dependent synthetase/ligase [Brevinemataceae bacterium]
MYLNFQNLADSFYYRKDKIFAKMFDGERFVATGYAQLYKNIKLIASYLQNLGIKKGDTVALLSENRPEWMMSYLGTVYNGVVSVPMDMMLTPEEVLVLLKTTETKIVFASNELFNKLRVNPDVLNFVQFWILFEKDTVLQDEFPNIVFFSDIFQQASEIPLIKQDIHSDDSASLIFTSGTTGASKAVVLSHGNFMHQINNLPASVLLTEQDIMLSILPLHHTFQFSVEATVLGVGGSITYAESFKSNRIIAAVKSTEVTVMVGIPALYAKILDGISKNLSQLSTIGQILIKGLSYISLFFNYLTRSHKAGEFLFGFLRKKAGMQSVRLMISGAAPLAYTISKNYSLFGFNLVNGYGLTEASPVVSVGYPLGPVDNKSVGNPVSGVSMKILDPDFQGIGEICISGDNVMQGYYNNPEATKNVLTEDGWLKTGDVGFIRKYSGKEFLYITGRYKNIIVTSGGKNVYPEEIEQLVNDHPYILESLVIGVSVADDDLSEVVCALIVINDPSLLESSSLPENKSLQEVIDDHIRQINSSLKMYARIRNYEILVHEFDKTSTRKIKRFEYPGKKYRYLLK